MYGKNNKPPKFCRVSGHTSQAMGHRRFRHGHHRQRHQRRRQPRPLRRWRRQRQLPGQGRARTRAGRGVRGARGAAGDLGTAVLQQGAERSLGHLLSSAERLRSKGMAKACDVKKSFNQQKAFKNRVDSEMNQNQYRNIWFNLIN